MRKFIIKTVGLIAIVVFTIAMANSFAVFRGGLLLLPLVYFFAVYFVPVLYRDWKKVLEDNKVFQTEEDAYVESLEDATGQEIKQNLYGEIVGVDNE